MVAFLIGGISLLACLLAVVVPAWGQDSNGIGVVTALTGDADLTRPQVSKTALKFRDDLFVRDVIDTHEDSLAGILLMGKSSVTVRELSRFEIRRQVAPGPGQRAVLDLVVGKIRVMVARPLMKPGDEVQIRTPNVFAGVRGTDGIFEVITLPDGTTRTIVTGISGEFEVRLPRPTPLPAMAGVVAGAGPPINLAPVQVIRIRRGDRLLVDPTQVVTGVLSPADLQQLIADFRVPIAARQPHFVGWPGPNDFAVGLGIAEIAGNPFPEPIVPPSRTLPLAGNQGAFKKFCYMPPCGDGQGGGPPFIPPPFPGGAPPCGTPPCGGGPGGGGP